MSCIKNCITYSSRIFKKRLLALIIVSIFIATPVGYYAYQTWFAPVVYDTLEDRSPLSAPPEEIKGKVITLRILREEFFIDFHNAFSSTVRYGFEFPEVIDLDYTIRWLKMEVEKIRTGSLLMYCIFDNKDNKLIGATEIRTKNEKDPGQFSWWLNESYWGGGRAREACKLITNIYFRLHDDIKSYNVHVRLWNKRSYEALKKSGFKEVGYFYEKGKPARHILEMYRDRDKKR